ncbi:unnamed protein product [Lathyrus sativus]|nr:unnamed protein product [Lathyrus sativus]
MKANFMKRYNELCPRIIKLINRALESYETYTFLSKVYEESSKIVDDMLAKKYVNGESSGMVHVFISITNDKVDNVDTVGMAKGIKKRDGSRNNKKLDKFWVEKLARKSKRYSKKENELSRKFITIVAATNINPIDSN